MKLDNWPLDRIMRLPDWCFGRRYWVGTYTGDTGGKVFYDISEENLPDKFVVWGVLFSCNSPGMTNAMRATLRLGTRAPLNVAETMGLDRVLKGISQPDILYEFYVNANGLSYVPNQRLLVESAGRRIVVVTNGDQSNAYEMTSGVIISALPKEINEWLYSDHPGFQW